MMSIQQTFHHGGEDVFTADMHPAFEPSPDFDFEFEAEPDHMMMSESYGGNGDFPLFDVNIQANFPDGPQQQGGCPNPYQQGFAANQALARSMHDAIVNRMDSVTQYFGQITPPESDSTVKTESNSTQAQDSDALKRKERARNAANKRHAKGKKAATGNKSVGVDEEVTEERGERQAHYREKNRVAAAKCRAKKKNHNDNLEEIHRDEASKNKILKAELMGLRNGLAQLKGLTLEHGPDNCHCHGIHEYSMRQANLIARGAAPQYGQSHPSPTQESVLSGETPVSEMSGDAVFSGHEQMSPVTDTMPRRTSSFAPGNWMQQP